MTDLTNYYDGGNCYSQTLLHSVKITTSKSESSRCLLEHNDKGIKYVIFLVKVLIFNKHGNLKLNERPSSLYYLRRNVST